MLAHWRIPRTLLFSSDNIGVDRTFTPGKSLCGKLSTKSPRKVLKSSPWARHFFSIVESCKGIREEPMTNARFVSFVLAGVAAVVLQAAPVPAAVKSKWIDYKQVDTALSGYLVYDDAAQG